MSRFLILRWNIGAAQYAPFVSVLLRIDELEDSHWDWYNLEKKSVAAVKACEIKISCIMPQTVLSLILQNMQFNAGIQKFYLQKEVEIQVQTKVGLTKFNHFKQLLVQRGCRGFSRTPLLDQIISFSWKN